jgi:hypothetical protein
MKVEEYRAVRQGRGVPMVEYTRKAYLRCIVHAIHMCMCKATVLSEEEGICIFYNEGREHPQDCGESHHSFDSNSPCQYTHICWPRIP